MALILLPTIELEPSAWALPGHDALLGTAQWQDFWAHALSLWHVKPFAPGAWEVSTDRFESDDTLTRLSTLALHHTGVQGFPDQDGNVGPDEEGISALPGGYALVDAAGHTAALPSCCCDLGDLGAWRRAASLVEGAGLQLEIGHGNWSAHRRGASVILTERPETKGFEPAITSVSADELLAASHVAEQALERFRLRLVPSLCRLVEDGARAERLSWLLAGLPVG